MMAPFSPVKRPRRNSLSNDSLAQTLLEQHNFDKDDFWETARLFTVLDEDGQMSGAAPATTSHKRKRDNGSPG